MIDLYGFPIASSGSTPNARPAALFIKVMTCSWLVTMTPSWIFFNRASNLFFSVLVISKISALSSAMTANSAKVLSMLMSRF